MGKNPFWTDEQVRVTGSLQDKTKEIPVKVHLFFMGNYLFLTYSLTFCFTDSSRRENRNFSVCSWMKFLV